MDYGSLVLEANGRGKGGNGVPCCTDNHIINQGFENLCDAYHVITLSYLNVTNQQLLALPLPSSVYVISINRAMPPSRLLSSARRTPPKSPLIPPLPSSPLYRQPHVRDPTPFFSLP